MTDGIAFRIEKTFAGRGGCFSFRAAGRLARGRVSGCCGPSGSGKTTLLRAIAGLEKPEAGEIRFGDRTWFSAAESRWVPPWKRSAALVFQDYPLLPHLSLLGNVRYGAVDDESADESTRARRPGRSSSQATPRAFGRTKAESGSRGRPRLETGSPPPRRAVQCPGRGASIATRRRSRRNARPPRSHGIARLASQVRPGPPLRLRLFDRRPGSGVLRHAGAR